MEEMLNELVQFFKKYEFQLEIPKDNDLEVTAVLILINEKRAIFEPKLESTENQ